MEVAVAASSCASPADAGAYALPGWALLGRSSPTESSLAGPTTDVLEAQIAAAPVYDLERARLRLQLARTIIDEAEATPQGMAREQGRSRAAQVLAQLLRETPDAPDSDTALFLLGWLMAEMGQPDRARMVFHQLIRVKPNSGWVPMAYLLFGDFYFGEGDMPAALQFYGKVLEYPPSQNRVHVYALYRLAAAHARLGDLPAARHAHFRLMAALEADAPVPDREALSAAARRDACGLPP